MKLIKNIALSLCIVAFSASISSIAFAGPVDEVTEKITAAEKAIASGSSSKDIILLIREAARIAKEVPAGDNVDVKRQRASGFLKKARLAVKKGKLDAAKKHLAEATKRFIEVKKLL